MTEIPNASGVPASAADTLLEGSGLHTFYGVSHILHGVDFAVRRGETIGLMGRNGMGKTTLIKTLLGLVRPREGQVRVRGEDMTQAATHAIARRGIAYVPEGRGIFPNLSVRENLVMAARAGVDGRREWDFDRVIQTFPRLGERLANGGAQLSGGEQQMLTIGRALMTNPDLLILDEATEGLAPLIAREIWNIIKTIRASGIATVIVDKNYAAVMALADRSVVLVKGRVVFSGESRELADNEELMHRFLGSEFVHSGFLTAGGHRLEYQLIPAHQINRPTLVLLHEGLGSVAMWRDFPARLAAATGCRTLVYSRYGYGQSDLLQEPFGTDYMHREGRETLPEVLAALEIENPVLVGHSDGASIALLHAGAGHPVAGLVVMAPHCFVEDISISSIAAAKVAFETTDLPAKLGKYHRDVNRTFWGWNDIWLHPDFRAWNIEYCLPGIRAPILAIQGEDDEYGTMAQVEAIASGARNSAGVELLKLADCRHSAHKDQTQAVIEAVNRFVENLDLAVPPAPTF